MNHYLLAAIMVHCECGYSVKSLAWKNKNPGNIEYSTGGYRTYPTMADGFAALIDDIQANVGKPLGAFIAKYAPPNENNTSAYLQIICEFSGWTPETLL